MTVEALSPFALQLIIAKLLALNTASLPKSYFVAKYRRANSEGQH